MKFILELLWEEVFTAAMLRWLSGFLLGGLEWSRHIGRDACVVEQKYRIRHATHVRMNVQFLS